jgi:transposase-like protein
MCPLFHPPEFRQRAGDLARSRVKQIAGIAKELSISEQTGKT